MGQEIRNVSASVRNIDEKNRKVTFVSSTTTKDRHRTVLNQEGWKLENFNNNGIIGYQHNVYGNDLCGEKATPDDIIGKGFSEVRDGNLETDITFKPEGRSELADKVFEDVRDGFLKTCSVGFIPIGGGRLVNDTSDKEQELDAPPYSVPQGHTFHYEGQELLELSVVNIPSNPDALKKSFRDSTAGALNYLIKAFDGQYSLKELGEMRIQDVLDLLGGKKKEIKELTLFEDDTKVDDDKPDVQSDETEDRTAENIKKINQIRLKEIEEV